MGRVYLEDSNTPIYRRIVHALGAELTRCGMEVLLVNPEGFDNSTFHQFISQVGEAVYISNRSDNAILEKLSGTEIFFFEIFPGKLIFLHQDAFLGDSSLLECISKLRAWKRVDKRAVHLCIEPDNVADLASVGITNAIVVRHATEIEPAEPSIDNFEYGATFVGHVVPGTYMAMENEQSIQNLGAEAMQLRCSDFSRPLEPLVKAYSDDALNGLGNQDDQTILQVACRQWLRNEITGLTLPLRGWVFENCDIQPLTIFGGDPAYINGMVRDLRIERTGIGYHPAVYDAREVRHLYNKSRVSINISSLQFDHAVVNRFHDVIMSGGLCLTDARSGLAELTSAHAEVSWRTLKELHEKTDYYSRPENVRHRALLIKAIQKDIACNAGYPLLAQTVLEVINAL